MASFRGNYSDIVALRLAAEGVPLEVIERALRGSSTEIRHVCQKAVRDGLLKEMPPANWPGQTAPAPRLAAAAMPSTEDVDQRALALRCAIPLTGAQSKVLAVISLLPYADKRVLLKLACAKTTQPKTVDIHVYNIRKALKPMGIDIETMWGRGYRLTPLGQTALEQLLRSATP